MIEVNSPIEISMEKLPNNLNRIKLNMDITCDDEHKDIVQKAVNALRMLEMVGLIERTKSALGEGQ